jgi:hypothetical protein
VNLTPQTNADFLLIVLRNNDAAMRKTSDEKAVQGAQRLMLLGLVKALRYYVLQSRTNDGVII